MAIASAAPRLDELRLAARFARGLPRFLRARLTEDAALARIRRQLAKRDATFLEVFRRGMLERASSPYRALLRNAGVEYGDVERLVQREGIEGALEELYDSGVYVTHEEFKGSSPIRRGSLTLETAPEDFDNPFGEPAVTRLSGGSSGPQRSNRTRFALLEHDAAYHSLFLAAFDLARRPSAVWRPVPPSGAGLDAVLYGAKVGRPVERWFSQNRLERGAPKELLLTRYSLLVARLCGSSIPAPEHVPLIEAVRVARWLAGKRAAGKPAWMNAPASSAVRVCLAAQEHGLDIAGTFFRLGGEPLTRAKAEAIAATGSRAVCFYTMSELRRVGLACAAPAEVDDVHVVSDTVGVIRRERPVDGHGARAGVLIHTTLTALAGKLMLNVESGDYGELVERDCGCSVGALGFTRHLHTIRSYDKLTTEGTTFLGDDVVRLVEEVLPARFGGRPIDYQLVEEEEPSGLTRISLAVSPSVGFLDEDEVVRVAHDTLAAGPSYKEMMAGVLRDGGNLRVVRREPYSTSGGKLLPFHAVPRAGSTNS